MILEFPWREDLVKSARDPLGALAKKLGKESDEGVRAGFKGTLNCQSHETNYTNYLTLLVLGLSEIRTDFFGEWHKSVYDIYRW